MFFATEALAIYLIYVLGSRGSRREPGVLRHDLDAAKARIVARRAIQYCGDFLACHLACSYLCRRELRQLRFLFRCRRRVYTIGCRIAELLCQLAIALAGIAASARSDFRRQQRRRETIFVSRPYATVAPQE
jgi:hypothetical protein